MTISLTLQFKTVPPLIAQLPSSLHQSPDDPSANAFCVAAFVPDDDGKVVLPEGNVPDRAVSLIFFDLYEI